MEKIKGWRKKLIKTELTGTLLLHWVEVFLALIAIAAVVVAGVVTIIGMFNTDWSNVDAFMEILKTILQLAIGVEIARLLFSYSLEAIIELAVFVVARKLLLLDGDFTSLFLGIVALVLLFAARYYFMDSETKKKLFPEQSL
tara:strand:- start:96 stop:521 length:426 start_codon:yes stop_codon:yes gene_type:complete